MFQVQLIFFFYIGTTLLSVSMDFSFNTFFLSISFVALFFMDLRRINVTNFHLNIAIYVSLYETDRLEKDYVGKVVGILYFGWKCMISRF